MGASPVKQAQPKTEEQLLKEKEPLLERLTPRQSQILALIVDHIQEHCCAPTIRELCRDAEISSLNGVVDHLKALHRKGWIRHTKPGTARSYTLSSAAAELVPGLIKAGIESERVELQALIEEAEAERKKFKKILRNNNDSRSTLHHSTRELTEFIRDFPDNISPKLKKCKTPLEGALLIVNLVDDILCGG